MNLSSPLLGLYFGLHDASFSFDLFNKANSSNSTSFINILDEDDYAYIHVFKQLEDGSHMYIENSVEINISDDPMKPKIVYLGEILYELKRAKGTKLLNKYAKVFAYSYKDMPSMDLNVVVHNIVT